VLSSSLRAQLSLGADLAFLARWLSPLAYAFAGIQFLNGMGHTLAEIHGGTVPSVRFEGIAPGFYTAPLLITASGYLFWRLRKRVRLPVAAPPADT
jgi:hypothetical protein